MGTSRVIIEQNRFNRVEGLLAGSMVEIIAAAVNETEADTKKKAPVDTGNLRASYKGEVSNGGLHGEVATDVEYAPYVENGTRRQRAQPHLRPAYNKALRNARKRIRETAKQVES